MTAVTATVVGPCDLPAVTRVAIVTEDPSIRAAASRTFDAAPATWDVSLEHAPPECADVVVWGSDLYTGTGIVFDPRDPAATLSSIRAQAFGSRVISVCSVGGGQGATTVAIHLAGYAATGDGNVCLIDAEPGSATRFRLGMFADESRSWAAADDLMLAAIPSMHGFRVLLAPPSGKGDFDEVVDRCTHAFETVVVDAGTSSPVAGATRVLTMTPTVPSAHRARQLLWADDRPWVIVTNRLGRGGEASRSDLERILEAPITVELPHCPALRDAEDDAGLVAYSWTRWWWAFRRLIDHLGL